MTLSEKNAFAFIGLAKECYEIRNTSCRSHFLLKREMARNRRSAHDLAMERLSLPLVRDEDVLEVLRRWCFESNKTRTNVFPAGATYVHSDTMGAVRNRVGRVVPTKKTIKHPAFFGLLSRWLEDNLPDVFTMPFSFTSINVNYGYLRDRYH